MKTLIAVGDDPARIADALPFAEALAIQGSDAWVLAGARGTGPARIERDGRLVRLVRTDPAPRHWQRSRSIDVARLLRAVLAEERIELLHVVDGRGLTHDLVAVAESVGVPAIVELASPAQACLVGDRVRRDTGAPCQAALGPMPCLACADADPEHGPTPWVPIEARFLGVAERRRDAVHELELARCVLIADERDREDARRALDSDLARVVWRVIQSPPAADEIARIHVEARAAPLAGASPRPSEWWADRMQAQAEASFDESYQRARSPA